MNGIDEYKNELPQAWINFQGDFNLKGKARQAFLNHLKKFKGGDIREHAKVFFIDSSHQLIGPQVILQKNENLGRVENKSFFDSRILRIYIAQNKKTAASLKSASALSAHLLPSSSAKLKFLQKYLGTMKLSLSNMWSFRNEKDYQNPFSNGIIIADMPCVLGLKSVAPPFYLLEYKLSYRAYAPTAFDASFFEEWRPGGRSYPLPSCRKKYPKGLLEIIHKPTRFIDLEKPLEVVK